MRRKWRRLAVATPSGAPATVSHLHGQHNRNPNPRVAKHLAGAVDRLDQGPLAVLDDGLLAGLDAAQQA